MNLGFVIFYHGKYLLVIMFLYYHIQIFESENGRTILNEFFVGKFINATLLHVIFVSEETLFDSW